MKDGVAVFLVTRAGHFREILNNHVPVAQREGGKHFAFEALVDGRGAGQKAAVEQGHRELKIVRVNLVALLKSARGGTGAKSKVPHGLCSRAQTIVMVVLYRL